MSVTESPHVVILGGMLMEPFVYGPMRRRLLDRGAATVTVAPLHAADWMAAALVGMGPLLLRAGVAIRRTHRRAAGRPLLVVGHSGGGIVARLAMSPVPYQGRFAGVADAVGCLVTLGAPHGLARAPVPVRHPGVRATAFLDRACPGAWFAPTTRYLTVASTAVPPRADHPGALRRLLGLPWWMALGDGGPGAGDGLVAAEIAHLRGADQMTFDDVVHGSLGSPWYGDEAAIDRWWPTAVRLWQEALEARDACAAGVA